MRFGERLKLLREARGLSRSQLAHLARLRVATVSDLERGKNPPRGSTVRALAQALEPADGAEAYLLGRGPLPPWPNVPMALMEGGTEPITRADANAALLGAMAVLAPYMLGRQPVPFEVVMRVLEGVGERLGITPLAVSPAPGQAGGG